MALVSLRCRLVSASVLLLYLMSRIKFQQKPPRGPDQVEEPLAPRLKLASRLNMAQGPLVGQARALVEVAGGTEQLQVLEAIGPTAGEGVDVVYV